MQATSPINRAYKFLALAGCASVGFSVATPAAAVEDVEIATCAAMSDTVRRIACYDGLASKHGLAPETRNTTPADAGKWVVRTSVDPLNDKAIHTASLVASSGAGRHGDPIILTVRCANNQTEMYVNWNSYLGRETTSVTYRVGNDEAKTASWSNSTDNVATFFPSSPIPLLKQLLASDTDSFVARTTPYNASPITAVFDTAGATEALASIRKGCNW